MASMNGVSTPYDSQACRVSIGLPVYNGGAYISQALDSLLAQTYKKFQIIVCDNSSTDRAEEICRHNAERDSRIRHFRNPKNLGAGRNSQHRRLWPWLIGNLAAAKMDAALDPLVVNLVVIQKKQAVNPS